MNKVRYKNKVDSSRAEMNTLQLSNPYIPNNNRVNQHHSGSRAFIPIGKYLHSLSLTLLRFAPQNVKIENRMGSNKVHYGKCGSGVFRAIFKCFKNKICMREVALLSPQSIPKGFRCLHFSFYNTSNNSL